MAAEPSPFIVGIGASAGGIEALEGLFRNMSAQTGLAFVVVVHLSPDHDSTFADILGRFTSMPVTVAQDDAAVRPDRVYVNPAGAVVTIKRGRLRLQKRDPTHPGRNPVDAFLSSLADDRGEHAIGIILSGAGSDGALGVKTIKERGGLVIAQGGSDQSGPRHEGMPASAIASGMVDLVLPVETMPEQLAVYVRSFGPLKELTENGGRRQRGGEGLAELRQQICAILRSQVGHDFSGYKDRTFMRRVQRRMQVLLLDRVADYVERLRRDPEEAARLFRDLLIGVTNFFRDKEAFDALERLVIPRLFEGKRADDTVRIWVPGCSTGEEAYSIALLLREHMDTLSIVPRVQVFASDIDEEALEIARTARYPTALLEGLSSERRRRFFTADGGTYMLAKQVRDLCIFSAHSIVRDPPFSRIDLISCRNLLIYLGSELQAQIIPIFHYALRPGGFLFLGSSESVSQYADLFAPLDRKHRIFQVRNESAASVRVPIFVPSLKVPQAPAFTRLESAASGLALKRAVEMRMLERHAPAHVVVSQHGDILYYSARTGKYLEPAPGQPSRQLLAMARKGLRLDLRAALQEATRTRRPVVRERVEIEIEEHVQLINLTIEPLTDQENDPSFLVLFEDVGPLLSLAETELHGRSASAADVSVEQLERELRETREQLQATIEEYETAMEELKSANEELVSVNEEVQSTNEELETSKEEIQSVNEELHTVNQELSVKVDQLNQANADLRNLFEGIQITIVFLDRQLVIRNFTPTVTDVFSLIVTDRGRPLADITTHLDHPGLHEDLQHVLIGGEMIERRVSLRTGRKHYLMRILPYRTDGTTDGLVLTFIDMTSMVEAEQRQQNLLHELNHRVRNMLAIVGSIARQTLARTPSPAKFTETFLGRLDGLARTYGLVARESWGEVALAEIIREGLDPHLPGNEDRIMTKGPPVQIRPKTALALGIVVHELATNAMKHGALSIPQGRVAVEWYLQDNADGRSLGLKWQELDGPSIKKPEAKAFGLDLIEREVGHELGGQLTIDFSPQGLLVGIALPL